MALHIVENERLRLTVADAGAELIGVYDKARGSERIWTGEPEIWNRHAPILFPFVGKVVNGQYRVGKRVYDMPTQHGFARDREFTCVEVTETSITHRLESDDWTLARYPYPFRLTVTHVLAGDAVRVEWTVENPGREPMYFSIGGHPGFLLPEGVRKEDCFILFPGMDALHYISTSKAGFARPERKDLELTDGRVPYRADIPDTWIFEDHQVNRVGIATPDGKPYALLDCDHFPMLAVWANPKGPFICLEPWFGRTDDEGFAGTIAEKKGMQALDGGARRAIAYSMTFL